MSAIGHIRKNVLRVSQSELGAIAGVTQATVSRWEAGELNPDLRQMALIRAAARRKKGAGWKDALFFDPPPCRDADVPKTASAHA